MTTWTTPTWQAARQRHICNGCNRLIQPGEGYERGRGFDGSDAWTYKWCAGCQACVKLFYASISSFDEGEGITDLVMGYWADEGCDDITELRARAGWRHRWRTQSGALWPIPEPTEQETGL